MAFGQAGAPAQPDTLQALLMEVRQLRQTLVVIQRLAVQQQHVDALSRQLDQVQQQIAQSAQESNTVGATLAANEARLCRKQDYYNEPMGATETALIPATGAARLSDHAVAVLVKKHAAAAGLDPAQFSGHSLRAGLVTSAARAGVPERVIMRQTGHRSVEMVLKYVRSANAFRENALNSLGL